MTSKWYGFRYGRPGVPVQFPLNIRISTNCGKTYIIVYTISVNRSGVVFVIGRPGVPVQFPLNIRISTNCGKAYITVYTINVNRSGMVFVMDALLYLSSFH
jgi:hypothetical protein